MINKLYLYIIGFYDINIEGFYIKEFINLCKKNKIILWNVENKNSVNLHVRICYYDLKKIQKIAQKLSCEIDIKTGNGIPIILKKYHTRRIFILTSIMMVLLFFLVTRFIWNIEVKGNSELTNEEIISEIGNYGIAIGKLKYNLNLDEIENGIRLENDSISWIGIKIKGTNVIVEIDEKDEKPEIIDKTTNGNIISNENAIISKIIVRSGTAKVNVGDEVNIGDVLVEGIMEGKYTGIREVYCDADVYGKKYYEKEKFEKFIQEKKSFTGRKSSIFEIYIKNFKIIFNKGVSKFEKYDTIRAYKKVKLFSNYYLPIEIIENTQSEQNISFEEYSENELIDKIIDDLNDEIKSENKEDVEFDFEYSYEVQNDGILVRAKYSIEKIVGINEGKEKSYE